MSIYDALNPNQLEAVLHTEGPLLILAGAGSGKTRVLTHRIAYMIEEKGINPWNILAITFTNKAASEMRERVDKIVGFGSEHIWVSTFHSSCVRILRRHIDKLGYDNNFTIYDGDDQKSVIKDVCKRLNIDTKIYKERSILSAISSAKDELTGPDELMLQSTGDYAKKRIAEAYKEYQNILRSNNALDFDDLIVKTVELFLHNPDILEYYQDRFRYIMVDEYQDTNTAQFKFVSLLASKYRNLCVVGDDDQSIYKFRGANIYNILNFEHEYPDAKVIKLEENYRSTKTILNAANGVIHQNRGRKDKTLWTANDQGDKIRFLQFNSEYEEAMGIVEDIAEKVKNKEAAHSDCAILYRTNAQSRVFEEKFVIKGIPYKIVGGQNFYQRKEIKDLLCYLKTIDNAQDDIAVKRIINVPKRGIGLTSMNKVDAYALSHELNFYDALKSAKDIPTLGKTADKISGFVNLIQVLRSKLEFISLPQLMQEILEETGYVKELEADGSEEALGRIENIDELVNKVIAYEDENENPTLSGFLEEVALVADIDSLDNANDKVVLMTLHSAKGLEFPYVYMGGMEDGLFPSYMTIIDDDAQELEEERRLCYVGITRAMKQLTLSCAKSRMIRGMTQSNAISRFIEEIPEELMEMNQVIERKKRGEKMIDTIKTRKPYETGSETLKSNSGPSSLNRRTVHKNSDFFNKPYSGVDAVTGNNQKTALEYGVGDTVRHIKFGIGEVINIIDGGKDYEVTVNFEKFGVKKMFAGFAKLQLI